MTETGFEVMSPSPLRGFRDVLIFMAWILGGATAGLSAAFLIGLLMMWLIHSEAIGLGILLLGLMGGDLLLGIIVGVMKAEDSWKARRLLRA
jgi:hypothetical protein